MEKLVCILFSLLLCLSGTFAAYCSGHPNPNWEPNLNPIVTDEPVLLRTVNNGKLYQAGPFNKTFYIAHIWGSPYELGLAHGQLLSKEISIFMNELWAHLEADLVNPPDWLPISIWDEIARVGLDALLELTAEATAPYTPAYWFEELHGLADGVNDPSVTYTDLLHVSLLGELTKGTCSMFGAWGNALSNVPGIDLLQLRALDWDTSGPFPKYPAVLVYHPKQGHPFANVGWTGWIGSITGISSSQMAISEIGVYFPDDTWGEETRFGYPFTMVLRDILQFDNHVDDSITRLANTKRTCNLLFGVGDGKESEFRGFEYSYSVLKVFDDQNLEPNNATWHPRINDIVYWGMDWLCPGFNSVLSQQLHQFYGNITVENTIKYILPAMQTGSTHVALYDLTNSFMYYSHVAPEGVPNRVAYSQPFTRLNMTELFAVTKP